MNKDQIKQEILRQIKRLAKENDGVAPGQIKFASETGIKDHVWRGRFWRGWGEALIEAGFSENEWSTQYDETELLSKLATLTKSLGRFPKKIDLTFESNRQTSFPSIGTFQRRWSMSELAFAAVEYGNKNNDAVLTKYAQDYIDAQPVSTKSETFDEIEGEPLGHVYMYRYGADYKIGRTHSLNKRSRQIQIELPQETVLVHSILTDDPTGIEAYWHKRFDDKRTRGEWFKLTKSDIAAFKRWSKIW